MNSKRTVLLLSGGLDSTSLLYSLRHDGVEVHCLMFDYGQVHRIELEYAARHCRKLGVINHKLRVQPIIFGNTLLTGPSGAPEIGDMVVPNRNMVFLSMAVAYAESQKIKSIKFASTLDDREQFPDCRVEFVDAMNGVIVKAGLEISIEAPYINLTKKQVVKMARLLDFPIEDTYSCYRGKPAPCGVCYACTVRQEAMRE